jgi:hypothetical protein
VDNYKYGIGPRIGLAYQITPKTVLRAGWGFVYAPVADIGISTANSLTNSPAGVNAFFNVQDPATMPQPVFPNFNPSVYPLIVNGAGTVNNALQALDPNAARPPRQNQWSIGLQRELTRNLVVEASYVANRGVWWGGPLGLLDQVSPDTFAAAGLHPYTNAADNLLLSSAISSGGVAARGLGGLPYAGYPTGSTLINTLRPFPQFASAGFFGAPYGVTGSATGRTWYDSLQAKGTQRLSHGLSVTTEFTWSKALANPITTQDIFNPNSSIKQLQSTDQPFLFNVAAVYTTPKARFLDNWKAASWVARDWQIGVSASYGSGTLLTPPSTTTTNNLGTSQMVRVPGQPLYLKDLNCHCINPWSDQLLNPLAWTNPTSTGQPDYTTNNSGGSVNGVFGPQTFYGDFRGPRRPIENLNFGRNFRIKERMNFQIRAEFTNALNRTFLGNPSTTTSPRVAIGRNGAGQITSGFGTINATFSTGTSGGFATLAGNPSLPRQGTLIARFTF